MFLRKIFEEFLVLHTEAEPSPPSFALPTLPWSWLATDERPVHEPPRTWALDWRWLETVDDAS